MSLTHLAAACSCSELTGSLLSMPKGGALTPWHALLCTSFLFYTAQASSSLMAEELYGIHWGQSVEWLLYYVVSHSVVSNSLRPHRLQLAKPSAHGISRHEYWVCCHFPLQVIFPTQLSNLHLLYLLHWQADSLVPPGKPSSESKPQRTTIPKQITDRKQPQD